MRNNLTRGMIGQARYNREVSDSLGVYRIEEIYCGGIEDYFMWQESLEVTVGQIRSGYGNRPTEVQLFIIGGRVADLFDVVEGSMIRASIIVFNDEVSRRRFMGMSIGRKEEECKLWWKSNKDLYLGMLKDHIKNNGLLCQRKTS